MATRLTPYLNFDGETGEAMAFYHAVFGGDLSVMRFGDLGRRDGVDPDGVMHATLSTPGGLTLMASDLPPGTRVESGNTFSVCLSGDDAEELAGYLGRPHRGRAGPDGPGATGLGRHLRPVRGPFRGGLDGQHRRCRRPGLTPPPVARAEAGGG